MRHKTRPGGNFLRTPGESLFTRDRGWGSFETGMHLGGWMFARLRFALLVAGCLLAPAAAADLVTDCHDCPELTIVGDTLATLPDGHLSPLRGFTDAVLRQDPENPGRIHLVYSWPNIWFDAARRAHASVEPHYAISNDGGRSFRFAGVLHKPDAFTDASGTAAHIAIETPNILPVTVGGRSFWVGAFLQYLVPDAGGFGARRLGTYHIAVVSGATPQTLDWSSAVQLGAASTELEWQNVNLTRLSRELSGCTIWSEPALAYDRGYLYLALTCGAFQKGKPDLAHSGVVLFSTQPEGAPSLWQWHYNGVLAGAREAAALGGQHLSQTELAKTRDGAWMALFTVDDWDPGKKDFVHKGCIGLMVASLANVLLAHDKAGRFVERAIVSPPAGETGDSGACAYDPASATGILASWRQRVPAGAPRNATDVSLVQRVSGLRP
jgi:hypothetical protein